ncbi:MAG: hypothetical protein HYZ23_05280 [Chloroflexi bacterium]|nr:hypothetical protein [Chloroflexota bacterium]
MKPAIPAFCLITFPLILACAFTMTTPQADPNAFNTVVAQTLMAQTSDPFIFQTTVAQTANAAAPLPFGGNTAVPPTIILPTQSVSDEQAIKQALLAQLGWSESQLQFTLSASDGRVAYGSVVQAGAMEGAAWYAAKDSSGRWIIIHVGQGWPLCRAIQPYNFPVNFLSHCEDDSGNVIDRSTGQPPAIPTQPTVATPPGSDVFPPDPLGPAWTGFWIDNGACYDLDLMITATDATCDLRLDANNIFTPQNGALFEAAPYQYAPSLNTCKTAALTSASMDAPQITYACFKTNAGKYGFLIPREVQANGVVFDAYLYP